MQLGKINFEQITEAAWASRVGVVFLSDTFSESDWCLRELNTFLLRRHQEPTSFTLLPVFYNSYLHFTDSFYSSVMGSIVSVIRRHEEAPREFLMSLMPRMLMLPELQHIAHVENALKKLDENPILLKILWNEYQQSKISKAAHHLFDGPELQPCVDFKQTTTNPSDVTFSRGTDVRLWLFMNELEGAILVKRQYLCFSLVEVLVVRLLLLL